MPRHPRSASLTVVGCGIDPFRQTTIAGLGHIRSADQVLYVVNHAAAAAWIETLNPRVESLHGCYRAGEDRRHAYRRMVERILAALDRGGHVCAVFYGHPGVYVWPSHEAIRRARARGFAARMEPAVSTEDCLFADLGIDPGRDGWQSHEATGFVLRRPRFDPTCGLVLWQVGTVGDLAYRGARTRPRGLQKLVEVLAEHYPAAHRCQLYRAAEFPVCEPAVRTATVGGLVAARPAPFETLYVPPLPPRPIDPAIAARLGIRLPRRRR